MGLIYKEKGGAKIGPLFSFRGYGVTWPLAQIEIFDNKEIVISVLWKRFNFSTKNIKKIEKVNWLPIIGSGIKITPSKSNDSIVYFMCVGSNTKLISNLKKVGYKVE